MLGLVWPEHHVAFPDFLGEILLDDFETNPS